MLSQSSKARQRSIPLRRFAMKHNSIALASALVLVLALSSSGQTPTFRVIHNFGASEDGSIPYGPLTLDGKGNLYGVTIDGGSTGQCGDYGCGTVFALIPEGNGPWAERLLHSFSAGNDGASPWGGLVFDRAGNLYGTLQGTTG